MTFVVVDTSVVAKLFFKEEHSDRAAALIRDAALRRDRVVAPFLLAGEMVNVLRRRMRQARLPLSEASGYLEEFLAMSIEYRESPELYRLALQLAERYSLGGFDAQYVALAQLLDCDLWVDDGHLLRAIAGRLPFVKWIGDYPMSDAEST